MILITVSCTGDYEHPYFTYTDNPEYAEEELADEALSPADN